MAKPKGSKKSPAITFKRVKKPNPYLATKRGKIDFFLRSKDSASVSNAKQRKPLSLSNEEVGSSSKVEVVDLTCEDEKKTKVKKRQVEESKKENITTNSEFQTELEKGAMNKKSACVNDDICSRLSSVVEDKDATLDDFKDDDLMNELMDVDFLSAFDEAEEKFQKNELFSYRYKAVNVERNENGGQVVVSISAKSLENEELRNVHLKDEWCDMEICVGDIFNILSSNGEACSSTNDIIIDSANNLIVLHPDVLVSSTTVSNSLGCTRRAILNEMFKNTEIFGELSGNACMLVGNIVHHLFQQVLSQGKDVNEWQVEAIARDIVDHQTNLTELLLLNTSKVNILQQVAVYYPQIVRWVREHSMLERKKFQPSRGLVKMQLPDDAKNFTKCEANLNLERVADIEENCWSPIYGLKGKIDVTGNFQVRNCKTNKIERLVLPVEIKTGRDSFSMEHRIQVVVYSLFCMSRRTNLTLRSNEGSIYDPLPLGLLLYLKTGKTMSVAMKDSDRKGVVQLRNTVARYKKTVITSEGDDPTNYQMKFPETAQNERMCQRCDQLRNCGLIYKSADLPSSSPPTSQLQNLFDHHTGHLQKNEIEYFRHWMSCIMLEHQKKMKKNEQTNDFWLKDATERSRNGSCITNLQLCAQPTKSEDSWGGFIHTFKRCGTDGDKEKFQEKEMIILSGKEPEFIALAYATIHQIDRNFISLKIDRDVSLYGDVMKYTIDKFVWASATSMQSSVSNLSVLMTSQEHCDKLRRLIIQHEEPTFHKDLSFIPSSAKNEVARMLRGLNRTQRQAIKRVILAKDYTLVVGMPGSGKTTTIVAMIRILLLCGFRVLITSYTHSAVDNLLIKLIRYKVNFLRLGQQSKVHPLVAPYCDQVLSKDFTKTEQLSELYGKANVVGCTCLAATSHPFFFANNTTKDGVTSANIPSLDVCIVDEASQISQPICLAPLIHAKRFVLVGDHKQLPPLVLSRKAKEMGADESLFRSLTRHEPALCHLTLQYRMNNLIMEVSNHLTYEGKLECAHPSVGTATVKLNKFASFCQHLEENGGENFNWLQQCIDPGCSVQFFDSSTVCEEKSDSDSCDVENDYEAVLISLIAFHLIEAGCDGKEIGIIAPFRRQLKIIEEKLASFGGKTRDIEVNTVDKYQGRDKSVILISFVTSKEIKSNNNLEGQLLNDWRRLNVAITRSKHKLLMIGSVTTLNHFAPCKKLIDFLKVKSLLQEAPNRNLLQKLALDNNLTSFAC